MINDDLWRACDQDGNAGGVGRWLRASMHVLTTAPNVSSSPQVTQASGGVLANELLELNLRSTAAESAHLPMVTRR